MKRAQQLAILVPVTLNRQKYITIIDCGASNILISLAILKDIQATVIPQEGIITAYQGRKDKWIGITSPIILRYGNKMIECSFEIAYLLEDTPMLVGLDIFPSLRFSIIRVLVDFSDVKVKLTVVEVEKPNSIILFELEKDEKDVEFKQRRDQFL